MKIFKFDCKEFNSLKFSESDEVYTALDLKIKEGTKLYLFRHNINQCLDRLIKSDVIYLDFDNEISYFYYGFYRVARLLQGEIVTPSNFVYINSDFDFNFVFGYHTPNVYKPKNFKDGIKVSTELLNVDFVELLKLVPDFTRFEFNSSELNPINLILLGELYVTSLLTNKVKLIVEFDELSETALILSSILSVRSRSGFLTEDDYSKLVEELSTKLVGLKSLSERKEQRTTRLFRESIM